jgi:hypothetical protein
MRWTVPVPILSDLATFNIPTPFASCFRTLSSVALSIFGWPSFTPWATAHRCQKVTLSDFKSSDGRSPDSTSLGGHSANLIESGATGEGARTWKLPNQCILGIWNHKSDL